ncbi:MAG: hypothetical protein EOP33_06465 [Rickettsiaceae bacterium]|nr:MAG: hypothetical protein EOP33_06465 [Rickettsiaceae bacterium]
MGHKVNPDIFRLGVTKTWSYQLRTNKNFIKNLFIFRLLKNLFVNYNIPLFTWKKHRNQKVNDKLVLKGEQQISRSPLVSTNVLFSHVFFGMLNNSIIIESFFIEANLKQQLKKPKIPENHLNFRATEYQPWQPGYYKRKLFPEITRNKYEYFDLKFRNKLKLVFVNRKFRKLSKKSKLYSLKPVNQLSKDFYFFSANHNPKYNPGLRYFFSQRYKEKKIKNLSNKHLRYKHINELYRDYLLAKVKKIRLFFNKEKIKRFKARFKRIKPLRFLRNRRYYRLAITPQYINRAKNYKYKNRIFIAANRIAAGVAKLFLKKKALSKTPMSMFNMIIKQVFFFDKIYKNLSLLKYFIRSLKYFRFFGVKKRIFFCHNMVNLIINFVSLSKKTIMSKKLFLITQTIMYYSYSLSFWNFINMKKKYLSKFMLYKAISKTLFKSVSQITKTNKLMFSVTSQNKYKFGSSLVLNYILIKLGQYFNINEIVNPLSFFIKHLTCIAGYKILIRGRLTRKERAAVMIRSGKKMPLSTISANVDYSQGSKIMKFGMVGIKVYLLLKPSTLINLYRFSFRYN